MNVITQLKTAFNLLLVFTLTLGFIYPAIVTLVGQSWFPAQAHGSLIHEQDKIIGSTLIGQYFDEPRYFWGRPSQTADRPYNAAASSGSNLGPSNPLLFTLIQKRVSDLKKADPNNNALIPIDLVTSSGSGLDPEISPEAAFYQVARVAKARHIDPMMVESLVKSHIKNRTWGILGEPRVNVLALNIALDQLARSVDNGPASRS